VRLNSLGKAIHVANGSIPLKPFTRTSRATTGLAGSKGMGKVNNRANHQCAICGVPVHDYRRETFQCDSCGSKCYRPLPLCPRCKISQAKSSSELTCGKCWVQAAGGALMTLKVNRRSTLCNAGVLPMVLGRNTQNYAMCDGDTFSFHCQIVSRWEQTFWLGRCSVEVNRRTTWDQK
jgi:ribosomal protein L37E